MKTLGCAGAKRTIALQVAKLHVARCNGYKNAGNRCKKNRTEFYLRQPLREQNSCVAQCRNGMLHGAIRLQLVLQRNGVAKQIAKEIASCSTSLYKDEQHGQQMLK